MSKSRHKFPISNQGGFILITILLIIAVLFPIIIAFNSRTQINLLQAANFRDNLQALRLARSGVEGAIGLLKEDDASYDAKTDRWAIQFPALVVGEGVLVVKIEDEDGKININKIVNPNGVDVNAAVDRHLRKLIARLGGKPEVVDALIDWIDINNEVREPGGAEEEYYKEKGYQCKNGPLDALDELLMIKGFDKELLIDKGLKNYITVAPTDGKINVNTADIEVLYDINDELREGLVEEIVRYREENEFKNVIDVKNAIGMNDTLYAKIAPLIKVNSSIFTVHSKYTLGKVTKNVEATLRRDGELIATILWREL